jgi:hypothetical protein
MRSSYLNVLLVFIYGCVCVINTSINES